jgi:adenylate cyclase
MLPDYYAYAAGTAYNEMGRYQEAVAALKRHLAANPNNLVAHFSLVIAYVELGRDQDARAEAAEIMRISPQFGLHRGAFRGSRDIALNKRWVSDLRKAGLK